MMKNINNLDHISFLHREGLVKLFPEEIVTPDREAAIFFGRIPDNILDQRSVRRRVGEWTREWFLVTDDGGGVLWEEDLLNEFGVHVIQVDDMDVSRRIFQSRSA